MDNCPTVYLISLLLLIIMKIEVSVTNLDCYHGVCPQTQVVLTCTIKGSRAAWYYSTPLIFIATVTSEQGSSVSNMGFIAALVSNNDPGLTTNLSFTATTDKNRTQVRCVDIINRNSTSLTCTIMISGPSSDAPTGLGFTALTNTSVTLYWSPPTLYLSYIHSYTVEIRTASDNMLINSLSTGSNITSINVSTGLSQSVEYQYRVVALEPCGQYSMFTLDVLQAVPLITYTITNNTEDYTIFIFWKSPPHSSRPPLLYYKVYHNISSSLTVNITTVTNITLTGVLAGYTYIITVVPVNILGDGYPNKIIVIIPKEPNITNTSISVVTTSSQYHSVLITMSSTVVMTSDTSNIITTTTSSSSSVGIYSTIGIVGGIIVFILIVVVLVLTGCIMIRRQNKNNNPSGSPLTVSLRSIKDNNIEEISSNPVYAQVNKKPQPLSNQYNEVPPPISPYLVDNNQPPPIPLFHGENEPTVPPFNESMTTQYSEVKKKHVAPHVLHHDSTAAEGDYSVLKTGYIPHVPLHNVTAGEDYSVIKRDDKSHAPPYNTSAGGDYSVLKREERESRENNSQLQQTGLYSTLNNKINKPKGAGGIV